MRASGIVVVALLVVLIATPALAQDAGALRREIEQLRKQLEGLTERLQRLEAQPAPHPVAPPPVAQPAPPGTMQQRGPGGGTGLSAEELLRPRQPFALYQQRGSGQLLFDMGIAGDFVASVTQRNVAKANGGTFAGQENRFFPREVELELFGQIDPYARGEVRIEAGEEAPGAETSRSEEHTSELQSRPHLVCRLLLEKKKNKQNGIMRSPISGIMTKTGSMRSPTSWLGARPGTLSSTDGSPSSPRPPSASPSRTARCI